ncbi:MAG TPA: AMP-binding protein [Pseudonocardiaceae bacterium]|jgi:long-chain acyl-CoA synthetase|nr:AMP-binding protein [Pseudonocardiaceae bacterium]
MGERNLARQAERQLAALGEWDSLWFEGRWWTSTELADGASRLATGLIGQGVAPGDRVVVLMANCPEVLMTYTALWRAGAVVTPLIFLVSEKELHAALVDSEAVAVVTTAEFLPKVNAAIDGVPSVKFVVLAGAAPDGVTTSVPLLDHAELAASEPGTIVDRADDDLAALLYTGGTTGRSKGVPLTHANLFWCGASTQEASAGENLPSTLVPLPLAHAYGLLVTCIGMHQTEPHQTILMRWFDPAGWVKLAQEHRATRSALVPSMIQMLLGQPLEEADLSAMVAVSSGASPLAGDVRDEFEARVPSATVYEGYGCTESASIISSTPLGKRRKGSVGIPVPGCEVAIRDDLGRDVPAGTDGEICVRSPGVMSGYWQAPDVSATTVVDGWLHTGDIGHVDDDGYLYVVDRKKDLIIRGGFNVYPRDVEDVLLAHPAVAMAGVVGRPDPRLGEEVVAFVSLRPGTTVTADELTAHVKQRMAANKYPREIRIVDQVPLTSVGKLDRKRLRDQVRAGGAPA